MAHFKRGYGRTKTRGRKRDMDRHRLIRGMSKADSAHYIYHCGWLHGWPRYWDVMFHTRPKRARTKALMRQVARDKVDADNAAWPLGSRKPHNYYW